jgi:zinc transporter ZupT
MGTLVRKWPAAAQLLIVGFYVAFSLLIPTGIGFWLDKRASHEFPLFTLIGLGVGTLIMIYGVYRMVLPFWQEAKKEEREKQVYKPIRALLNLPPSKQQEDKEQKDKEQNK